MPKKAVAFFESSSSDVSNPNEILVDMYQASQLSDAYSASSTYKELISSGQINLIQHDNLKSALIRYYERDWSETGAFNLEDKYRVNLRGKIPNEIQSQIRLTCGDVYVKKGFSYLMKLPDKCDFTIDPNTAQVVIAELHKDESLKNDLRYLIGNEAGKLNDLIPVQAQLDRLHELLEGVINN